MIEFQIIHFSERSQNLRIVAIDILPATEVAGRYHFCAIGFTYEHPIFHAILGRSYQHHPGMIQRHVQIHDALLHIR